jgi:ATP-dependent Zn protease
MSMNRVALALGMVVALVFGLALLWTYLVDGTEAPTYPYSQLVADAAAGRVESITQDGVRLTVTLNGESEPRSVTIASESVNVYAEVCAAAGADLGHCPIEYTAQITSEAGQWLGLLISALLPVLLIGVFIYFMMRQAQRGRPGG